MKNLIKPIHTRTSLTQTAFLTLAITTLSLPGAPITWNGATSTDFTLGGNWVGGVAPVNDLLTDIATFSGVAPANQPVLSAPRSVNGVAVSGSGYNISGTGPLTVGAGNIVVNSASGTNTISLALAGAAGLNKSGASTLVLNGANTFTGAVNITGGGLNLESTADSLASASSVTAAGGVLRFNNATAATYNVNSLTTSNDVVINNGSLVRLTSGTLNFGATNFWMQTAAGATGRITSTTNVLTVTANTPAATDQRIRVDIVNNGANAVSLVKNGTGRVALGGMTGTGAPTTYSYTGGTTINGGVLELIGTGGSNGIIQGTVNINSGGELRLGTGDATGFGTGAQRISTININGGTLSMNNASGNQTFSNMAIVMTGGSITRLAGNGNFDMFNGSSSFTTLASANTATVANGVTIGMRQPNTVFSVAQGTTASGVDLQIDGAMIVKDANAGMTKTGLGTMALAGTNTYTGATNVNQGKFVVNGSLSVSSTVSVGDVFGGTNGILAGTGTMGDVNINGGSRIAPGNGIGTITARNLTMFENSIASLEIGATTSDVINLTGYLDMTGTGILDLALLADPTDGTLFTIINGAQAFPVEAPVFSYMGNQLTNGEQFTVSSNSFVQDFIINYGGVDGFDVTLLAVVPEPSVAVLGGLSALAFLGRRRRVA